MWELLSFSVLLGSRVWSSKAYVLDFFFGTDGSGGMEGPSIGVTAGAATGGVVLIFVLGVVAVVLFLKR